VLVDPATGPDGHSYEHHLILRWVRQRPVSPITRQPMPPSSLVPNRALRDIIAAHPVAGPRAAALRQEYARDGVLVAWYAPPPPPTTWQRVLRLRHNRHVQAAGMGVLTGTVMLRVLLYALQETAFAQIPRVQAGAFAVLCLLGVDIAYGSAGEPERRQSRRPPRVR